MKKIILILLLITSLTITGCFNKNNTQKPKDENIKFPTISSQEVKEIIDNYSKYPEIDIIDLRSEEEFTEEHIPGALNIPLEYLDEITISQERQLILYDKNNENCQAAALQLRNLGYKNIKIMGGINNYPYSLE